MVADLMFNDMVRKSYCINLSHRTDRWDRVQEEFSKNRILVERFDAVLGKNTDQYPMLSRGAAGCMMSHIGVLRDAVENNYDKIAIFEDDVFFAEDFENKFSAFVENVPDDWQFIYLAANLHNDIHTSVPVASGVNKIIYAWSTHAMMLNRDAINASLNLIPFTSDPVDVTYGRLQEFYPAYVCTPALAGQVYPDFSDVADSVVDCKFLYEI
jgi:GR25 family glycosyltransferase involved in LPS biosynthesis